MYTSGSLSVLTVYTPTSKLLWKACTAYRPTQLQRVEHKLATGDIGTCTRDTFFNLSLYTSKLLDGNLTECSSHRTSQATKQTDTLCSIAASYWTHCAILQLAIRHIIMFSSQLEKERCIE